MSNFVAAQLPLAPLGAGDLIDRAVRLYRRHLSTLLRIASLPVLVTTIGWIVWTVGSRRVFITPNSTALALYILLAATGIVLVLLGHVFGLLVMGGATRNLVTHLLWNQTVSVRTTYAAVRSRFWALLGATLIMICWAGGSTIAASVAWYMVAIVIGIGAVLFAQIAPVWLSVLV